MSNNNIPTTNVWPYYAANNTSTAKQRGDQSLGKDAFLQILIAQLKNQDPMQPMEDKEFIAQMAQFTAVEQMQEMSAEMRWMRQSMGISSDLIGKHVAWEELQGNKVIVLGGTVDSIRFSGGVQYVTVGDRAIPIDRLIAVTNEAPDKPDEPDNPDDPDVPDDPEEGLEDD